MYPCHRSASQKVNQISKGDVNTETLIVPQTFEKASVKNRHMVSENQEA